MECWNFNTTLAGLGHVSRKRLSTADRTLSPSLGLSIRRSFYRNGIPFRTPPAGPVIWATVVVGCFVLSAATAIAAEARKHRVIRTRLGYWALAFLILSAAFMAAAVLGILAAFRAEGAATRFLPTTPQGGGPWSSWQPSLSSGSARGLS